MNDSVCELTDCDELAFGASNIGGRTLTLCRDHTLELIKAGDSVPKETGDTNAERA